MFEGHAPITGLSLIVTLNEQLDVPHTLDDVQVTVVVPATKAEPDAGTQVTVAAGLPLEVGFIHVATLLSHWVMFEGHAPITGPSLTVTLTERQSVALQSPSARA